MDAKAVIERFVLNLLFIVPETPVSAVESLGHDPPRSKNRKDAISSKLFTFFENAVADVRFCLIISKMNATVLQEITDAEEI